MLQYQLLRNTWYGPCAENILTSHRNLTCATFATSDDGVYICCQIRKVVQRFSPVSGDLKVAIYDVTTAFMDSEHWYFPRLCAVDSQKSLLLADEFDQLNVLDITGSCGRVELLPPLDWLKQAVFSNGKLCVLSDAGFKLSVYSADVTASKLMQQLGGQAVNVLL